MSISKGGQSVKPYVGSKEVKEAYVGSQLVYKASYPYKYAFLGTENDYMLADWCVLGQKVAIAKWLNIYRIALPYTSGPYDNDSFVKLTNIDSEKYKYIKFTAFVQRPTLSRCDVQFIANNSTISTRDFIFPDITEQAVSFEIPSKTTEIRIHTAQNTSLWLDAVRVEE